MMSDKGDCSVCEAATHGMHFGVSTCKACASFFRRSMVERKRYKCRFQDHCVINNKVRNNCRACRLKKCYVMGMVREGKLNVDRATVTQNYSSIPYTNGTYSTCIIWWRSNKMSLHCSYLSTNILFIITSPASNITCHQFTVQFLSCKSANCFTHQY